MRARFVEFNVDGLLRGDFKTRLDGYATAIENAILKPDEARAMENRPAERRRCGQAAYSGRDHAAWRSIEARRSGERAGCCRGKLMTIEREIRILAGLGIEERKDNRPPTLKGGIVRITAMRRH